MICTWATVLGGACKPLTLPALREPSRGSEVVLRKGSGARQYLNIRNIMNKWKTYFASVYYSVTMQLSGLELLKVSAKSNMRKLYSHLERLFVFDCSLSLESFLPRPIVHHLFSLTGSSFTFKVVAPSFEGACVAFVTSSRAFPHPSPRSPALDFFLWTIKTSPSSESAEGST